MNRTFKSTIALAALVVAGHAAAQVTFYEGEGFRGRVFSIDRSVGNFDRTGFNDRASSVVVDRGHWEVCEDAGFSGRCMVLQPGSYDSLRGMGMDRRISSVRPIDQRREYDNAAPLPLAAPDYEYRRLPRERFSEAPVTSVHAVVGPPEQRCWMERQQVVEPERRDRNVGGAIVGGLLGGILGHQVGGGRGNTALTIGGAVAGAAAGANVNTGNGGNSTSTQNVQRCNTAPPGPPHYWDVTYNFRGVEHHVQMSAPPGRTITVNGNGEPRT